MNLSLSLSLSSHFRSLIRQTINFGLFLPSLFLPLFKETSPLDGRLEVRPRGWRETSGRNFMTVCAINYLLKSSKSNFSSIIHNVRRCTYSFPPLCTGLFYRFAAARFASLPLSAHRTSGKRGQWTTESRHLFFHLSWRNESPRRRSNLFRRRRLLSPAGWYEPRGVLIYKIAHRRLKY